VKEEVRIRITEKAIILLAGLAATLILAQPLSAEQVIRVGFFPNITHAQPMLGSEKGFFQKALGPDVKIQMRTFNAGPAEIEALFAGEIDLGYIGPNPAINGFIRSRGKALRIVAGATSGGAVFVVRNDGGISRTADFAGKRFASPQIGNTQDVALRAYLKDKGFTLKEKGGKVEVIPIANSDIFTLFVKREIDGAWIPEPWGARLVREANGRIFLDEQDLWPGGRFVTAHVIARTSFLSERPELLKKWLGGHVETTRWINANLGEAKKILNQRIKELTSRGLAPDILDDAFGRMQVTYDPVASSLQKSADDAYALGFLRDKNIDGIYELAVLNQVLTEKGLKPLQVAAAKPK
jgi:NitT/TauT family transport system substrate-binding protein